MPTGPLVQVGMKNVWSGPTLKNISPSSTTPTRWHVNSCRQRMARSRIPSILQDPVFRPNAHDPVEYPLKPFHPDAHRN